MHQTRSVNRPLTVSVTICPQVKVMEIFDVTQTDPSLLVTDSMGVQYSQDDQVLLHDSLTRLRHSSGPSALSSKSRRNSVQGSLPSLGYDFYESSTICSHFTALS